MPPISRKTPTDLELEILQIIWDRGPSNVHAVRAALLPARKVAYTSVQTTLNTMMDKGLLHRVKIGREFTYAAAVSQQRTTRQFIKDLVSRVFGGNPKLLVENLLQSGDLDEAGLKELADEVAAKRKKGRP